MENPIAYHKMVVGFEFPPSSIKLDSAMVDTYIRAVGETSPLYRDSNLVPPTALAACTMAALSGKIAFPAGAIHVSQELEFLGTTCREDTVICQAVVSKKQDRGKLHLMTIDLAVYKDRNRVMTGKVGFVLPEMAEDSKL